MLKNPIFVCCAVLILGLFGLIQVKMYVHQLDDQVNELQVSKSDLINEIKVLKAEWHYLTRQERLEELSKKYLEVSAPKEVRSIEDFYLNKDDSALTRKKNTVKISNVKWNVKSREQILSKVKGLKNIGGHGIVKIGG